MESRISMFLLVGFVVVAGWRLAKPLATGPSVQDVLTHTEEMLEPVEPVEPTIEISEPDVLEPIVESDPECVDGECPPKVYYQRRGLFRWQKVVK